MSMTTLPWPTPGWPLPAELVDWVPAGPVVSLYLDTDGIAEDAAERVRLRWKELRRRLVEEDAPQPALDALEDCVQGPHIPGTMAAFATAAGLQWAQHLTESAGESTAVVGRLPSLVPLLAARQRECPYVVVATDRLGADLLAVVPDAEDTRRTVEGEELHVTRSAPGGWSQRRFQQRAENRWEANADEVAGAVTRLVDATGASLVVVTGDVRAVQFLKAALPPRVKALLTEVQGDYSNVDNAAEQASVLAADTAVRQTDLILSEFDRELGQGDKASIGAEPVLTALATGQAAVVLIDPTRTRGQSAEFDQTLSRIGLVDPPGTDSEDMSQAPLADVLIRSAAATGAAVQLVSADAAHMTGGVGALLRYINRSGDPQR